LHVNLVREKLRAWSVKVREKLGNLILHEDWEPCFALGVVG